MAPAVFVIASKRVFRRRPVKVAADRRAVIGRLSNRSGGPVTTNGGFSVGF